MGTGTGSIYGQDPRLGPGGDLRTTRIGLIDYGAGNLGCVRNALKYLGLNFFCICEPDQMSEATHLILPGVGAFASAMRRLEELRMVEALQVQLLVKNKPFLGICVGMQILATYGREFGDYQGLGVIEGTVERIDAEFHMLRVPHVGWNELDIRRPSVLFANMPEAPIFYFVHSYQLVTRPEIVLATCSYGCEITAAVEMHNIYGVQFHPEKSQRDGLQLLRNFAAIED